MCKTATELVRVTPSWQSCRRVFSQSLSFDVVADSLNSGQCEKHYSLLYIRTNNEAITVVARWSVLDWKYLDVYIGWGYQTKYVHVCLFVYTPWFIWYSLLYVLNSEDFTMHCLESWRSTVVSGLGAKWPASCPWVSVMQYGSLWAQEWVYDTLRALFCYDRVDNEAHGSG